MNRIKPYFIIICLVQIISYILLHDGVVNFYSRFFATVKSLSWGIAVQYLLFLVIGLLVIQNLLILFFERKRILITIVLNLVLGLVLIPFLSEHPLRSLNVFMVGSFVLWIQMPLDFFMVKALKFKQQ